MIMNKGRSVVVMGCVCVSGSEQCVCQDSLKVLCTSGGLAGRKSTDSPGKLRVVATIAEPDLAGFPAPEWARASRAVVGIPRNRGW